METLYYSVWESPIGPLFLAASERGLVKLEFHWKRGKNQPRAEGQRPIGNGVPDVSWVESDAKLRPYRRQLEEYFAGKRKTFSFALDLRGTDFQQRCWRALLDIPYGETRTYAEIARRVGRPQAFRAVGGANHDNPIAIVVPCHRVIASDGTLGGYGGGLPLKEKLLLLEGAALQTRLAL